MSKKKTLQLPKVGDMIVYPHWDEEVNNYFLVLSTPKECREDDDSYLHYFKAWSSTGKIHNKVYCLSYREDNYEDGTSADAWRYLDKTKDR